LDFVIFSLDGVHELGIFRKQFIDQGVFVFDDVWQELRSGMDLYFRYLRVATIFSTLVTVCRFIVAPSKNFWDWRQVVR